MEGFGLLDAELEGGNGQERGLQIQVRTGFGKLLKGVSLFVGEFCVYLLELDPLIGSTLRECWAIGDAARCLWRWGADGWLAYRFLQMRGLLYAGCRQ